MPTELDKDQEDGKLEREAWPEGALDEIAKLKSELNKVVGESKARKDKLKEFQAAQAEEQKKAEETHRAEQEAARQALKEQGKYKPLYEEAQKQLADLTATLELKASRAEAYETVLLRSVESRTKQLPEEYQGMVPKMAPDAQLEWLDTWQPKLTRPAPPDKDASAKLKDSRRPLTNMEREVARASGMTEEEYAKVRDTMPDPIGASMVASS